MATPEEHNDDSISKPKSQKPKESNRSLGVDKEVRGWKGFAFEGWREKSLEG